MTLKFSQRIALLAGLGLLMMLTRTTHFGASSILPDASLAVFLLGGLLFQRAWGFTVLMVLAFGADVVSARTAVEAGWCMTPAYWGLIPTYGILWLAGRWLGKSAKLDFLPVASVSVAAIALAFVVSNATWFMWSDTVGSVTAAEYAMAVLKYFPPYLGSAMLYLVPVWLGWKLTQIGSAQRV